MLRNALWFVDVVGFCINFAPNFFEFWLFPGNQSYCVLFFYFLHEVVSPYDLDDHQKFFGRKIFWPPKWPKFCNLIYFQFLSCLHKVHTSVQHWKFKICIIELSITNLLRLVFNPRKYGILITISGFDYRVLTFPSLCHT